MKGRIAVNFFLKMPMLVIYVIKLGHLFFYSNIIKVRMSLMIGEFVTKNFRELIFGKIYF